MPTIDSITLTNFGIHRKRFFQFGPGFNVIRGANEAGKTTILEAIAIAFFGSSALRGGWEDVVTEGEKVGSLATNLRYGQYTVHRSKASASVVSDDGKVEVSGHGDVTDFFLRHFGIEKGTERNVMIAQQGKIQGILESGNADATKFIENLANFDQIDQLVERMKAKYPVIDQQALNQQIAALEEKLTAKEAEELPDLAADQKSLKEWEVRVDAAKNKVAAAVDVLAQQNTELETLRSQKREFDSAVKAVADQEQAVSDLQGSQKKIADQVKILETEINCSKSRLDGARAFLADLEKKQTAYHDYRRVVDFVGCDDTWDESLEDLHKELEGTRKAAVVLQAELKASEKKAATLEASPIIDKQVEALQAKAADISKQKAVLKAMTGDSEEVAKLKQEIADVGTRMAVEKSKLMAETTCPTCGTDLSEKAAAINDSVNDELVLLNDTRLALEANLKAAYQKQRDARAQQEKDLEKEFDRTLKKTEELIVILEQARAKGLGQINESIGKLRETLTETEETVRILEGIITVQDKVVALLETVTSTSLWVNKDVYPWSVSWGADAPEKTNQQQIDKANNDVVYCTGLATQLEGKAKEFHKCCAELSAAEVKLTGLRSQSAKLKDPSEQIEVLVVSISTGKVQLVELQTKLNAQIEGVNAAATKLALDQQTVKKHGEDVAGIKGDIPGVRNQILKSAENNALHRAVAEARTTVIEGVWNTLLTAANECFSSIRGTVSDITREGKVFKVNGIKTVRLSGSTLDSLGLAMRAAIRAVFCPATDFVLLDEIAAGMDVERTAAAMAQVASLGIPQVILVTHEEVSDGLADNIVEV